MKKELVTGVITALLASNIITGFQYHKDITSKDNTIHTKDEIIKYMDLNLIRMNSETKRQQRKIDQLNHIIKVKESQIDNLKQQIEKATKRNESPMRQLNMEVTAYVSDCKGCSGLTYTEHDVRNTIHYKGYRIIAADFNKIPLYSIVEIETKNEKFEAIVLDTGGAIRGSNVIDLLVNSYDEAIQFGRQQAKIKILREGKG